MPKLLSRCKHKKFESNLALQIRDQKERRAENARKLKLQVAKLQPADTVHTVNTVPPAACSPAFHASVFFATIFGFFRY